EARKHVLALGIEVAEREPVEVSERITHASASERQSSRRIYQLLTKPLCVKLIRIAVEHVIGKVEIKQVPYDYLIDHLRTRLNLQTRLELAAGRHRACQKATAIQQAAINTLLSLKANQPEQLPLQIQILIPIDEAAIDQLDARPIRSHFRKQTAELLPFSLQEISLLAERPTRIQKRTTAGKTDGRVDSAGRFRESIWEELAHSRLHVRAVVQVQPATIVFGQELTAPVSPLFERVREGLQLGLRAVQLSESPGQRHQLRIAQTGDALMVLSSHGYGPGQAAISATRALVVNPLWNVKHTFCHQCHDALKSLPRSNDHLTNSTI